MGRVSTYKKKCISIDLCRSTSHRNDLVLTRFREYFLITYLNDTEYIWTHSVCQNVHSCSNVIKGVHLTLLLRATWWRHQMETFPALLALCAGNLPVNSPQWRGALIFFICAWTNVWVNNRDTDDLRRHRAHYDVTVINFAGILKPYKHTSHHMTTELTHDQLHCMKTCHNMPEPLCQKLWQQFCSGSGTAWLERYEVENLSVLVNI